MQHASGLVHCQMCGMEFERTDTVCAHGCPLGKNCNLVRCPNCGYEFPDAARTLAWLRRPLEWFRTRKQRPANGSSVLLDRMRAGERGTVLRLNSADAGRRNTLTVFGLTPGTEVTLLQRRPSFVIRVGETELGLDAEIAREILVKLI